MFKIIKTKELKKLQKERQDFKYAWIDANRSVESLQSRIKTLLNEKQELEKINDEINNRNIYLEKEKENNIFIQKQNNQLKNERNIINARLVTLIINLSKYKNVEMSFLIDLIDNINKDEYVELINNVDKTQYDIFKRKEKRDD